MSRRLKQTKSISRGSKKTPTKQKIIIVCEGKNTEPDYFLKFKEEFQSSLVEIDMHIAAGAPKTVVEKAIEKKQDQIKLARKSQNSFDHNFSVWAVFDRDEHDYVEQSRRKARDNGIEVIYSNPCFEIWAILHYKFYSAHKHRHDLQKDLSDLMTGYDPKKSKSLNYDDLRGNYDKAKRNSERLSKEQIRNGSADGNPSTNVEELCDKIILNGKKPKNVKT